MKELVTLTRCDGCTYCVWDYPGVKQLDTVEIAGLEFHLCDRCKKTRLVKNLVEKGKPGFSWYPELGGVVVWDDKG